MFIVVPSILIYLFRDSKSIKKDKICLSILMLYFVFYFLINIFIGLPSELQDIQPKKLETISCYSDDESNIVKDADETHIPTADLSSLNIDPIDSLFFILLVILVVCSFILSILTIIKSIRYFKTNDEKLKKTIITFAISIVFAELLILINPWDLLWSHG